jgi:hypothetical protein
MNFTTKSILLGSMATIFISAINLNAVDIIAITTPAASSTVNGAPLSMSGISSEDNFRVRLTLDGTEIGSATTDGMGNWNFTAQSIGNGNHALTADLMDSAYRTLATATVSFIAQNTDTIAITNPTQNDIIVDTHLIVTGASTAPSTAVELYLDGTAVGSTTTDANGNWQILCPITSNGAHTLDAVLQEPGNPTSTTIDINANLPLILPAGDTQIRVIDGYIPTSGSGSGSGYTYIVSGSTIIINFVPVFSAIPSILATGQRSSGSSTVTISSVSTTAVTIAFSTGTQQVHFTATALQ